MVVAEWVRRRGIPPSGTTVVVGVSGGRDSVVLLHLLDSLARVHRWSLVVAHFNHRLRGVASTADERFVRQISRELDWPVEVGTAGVRAHCRQKGVSIEMGARELRHQFLAVAAERWGSRWIALAHHADDQAETILLRWFRGAGGEGIAGMEEAGPSPADPDCTLIRPLLAVSRARLDAYALRQGLRHREDASNFKLEFQRNWIRRRLIPLVRLHVQPNLAEVVCRTAEIAGAESRWIADLAKRWCDGQRRASPPVLEGPGPQRARPEPKTADSPPAVPGQVDARTPFSALPLPLQRRVLWEQLRRLGVEPKYEWIETLRETVGRSITVAPAVQLQRNSSGWLRRGQGPSTGFNPEERPVGFNGRRGAFHFEGVDVKWRVVRCGRAGAVRRSTGGGAEQFDADRVGTSAVLRHWRPGDRFRPIGLRGSAKLQDLFVNLKVPLEERRRRLVGVAESGQVFWVEGLRIGEEFKIRKETRHILSWWAGRAAE